MLSWEFPPRIIGGISNHVYYLSKSLASQNISVQVVTCDFPKAPAEENIDGVQVSRVESGGVPQASFLPWIYHLNSQMIKRANELLQAEKYDLIHAHDWLVGRAALNLKAEHNLPLVTTIHATEMGRGGIVDNDYRKKVHDTEQRLVENSERVICCSNYMINHLQHVLGVPGDRIDIIPNGVDISRFNTDTIPRSEYEINQSADKKTILFVGRLVKEKGLFTLLRALQELQEAGKPAQLVIVGDGPMREEFTREAVNRGFNGNVRFTGFIDEPTLISTYKSSDVVALPSLYEPFGIVALEAMASKTPIVASDVGGLSEIVEDGVTGLKFPPGDSQQLAQALLRVLEDPFLAGYLKENAFQMIKMRYGWDQVAEKTLTVYEIALTQTPIHTTPEDEESLLGDQDLLQFLLATGATEEGAAKTAKEIASALEASEVSVKKLLGEQVSNGYISTTLPADAFEVRYYLNESGIIKSCSDLS
jgi:glycosyltransferase involved in cell wall biosynthesis